jgi:hypothetical protein
MSGYAGGLVKSYFRGKPNLPFLQWLDELSAHGRVHSLRTVVMAALALWRMRARHGIWARLYFTGDERC